MDHNMTPVPSAAASATRLQELIASLDQAAFMARQLPATSDPAALHQIHSTLLHAQHSLSSFLAAPPPLHPPPLPPPSASTSAAAENSLSSANHNGSVAAAAAEPMLVGDDEEDEVSRSTSIDRVEERMRNCFIKNKRPKRPLSPSAPANDDEERGGGFGGIGSDTYSTRLRALELVYQFHA